MINIVFYNHYHNGDLFYTKPFIKDIIDQLGDKYNYGYAHFNGEWVLRDLQIPQGAFQHDTISDQATCFMTPTGTFLVNTWIGTYFKIIPNGVCSWIYYHKIFTEIIKNLNNALKTDILIKPLTEYYPYIDYSFYECSNVDDFVKTEKRKKILFSNGPGHSNQLNAYNGNMSDIILPLAKNNPDKMFIITYPFDHDQPNVISTGQINRLNRKDLNEIGYLSRFCDAVIGRDSGPFCFTHTKENMMNPNKKFISFGGDPKITCFFDEAYHHLKCNFSPVKFTTADDLKSRIEAII